MFTLERVSVIRGGATLLCEVTAELAAGAVTVLTGPSGAGKTTLLRLLNRLEEPSSGQLAFYGRSLDDYDVLALRRRVTLAAQQPVLLTSDVAAELRVGRPDLDEATAAGLLRRVGLSPDLLSRATAGISGGEAQRLCLARVLAGEPEVLLLDEPTSHLDAASTAAIHGLVGEHRSAGKTVIAVSHDADWIRSAADTVLVLRAGRLVDHGPPAHVGYLGRTA